VSAPNLLSVPKEKNKRKPNARYVTYVTRNLTERHKTAKLVES
jgi:hypothetical protein